MPAECKAINPGVLPLLPRHRPCLWTRRQPPGGGCIRRSLNCCNAGVTSFTGRNASRHVDAHRLRVRWRQVQHVSRGACQRPSHVSRASRSYNTCHLGLASNPVIYPAPATRAALHFHAPQPTSSSPSRSACSAAAAAAIMVLPPAAMVDGKLEAEGLGGSVLGAASPAAAMRWMSLPTCGG